MRDSGQRQPPGQIVCDLLSTFGAAWNYLVEVVDVFKGGNIAFGRLRCVSKPGCEDLVTLLAGVACIDMHRVSVTCFRSMSYAKTFCFWIMVATSQV